MALNETLLPEFKREMANTRKMLERVPEDKLEWRPHQKSWTMGGLATHLSNIPTWVARTIQEPSLDTNPPAGGGLPRAVPAKSVQELLDRFDTNVAAARKILESATDPQLLESWSLLSGGKTLFTMPKIAVLRNFVMNHNVHHRAQLSVYLRLNDVPLPGMYGPSADES